MPSVVVGAEVPAVVVLVGPVLVVVLLEGGWVSVEPVVDVDEDVDVEPDEVLVVAVLSEGLFVLVEEVAEAEPVPVGGREEVAPEEVAPDEVAPEEVAADEPAPEDVALEEVAPEDVVPEVVGDPDREEVLPEAEAVAAGPVGFHGAGGGMPGTSGPLGWSTRLSTTSARPVSRANQPPVSTFTRTISGTGCGAGTTTISVLGSKPVQAFPVYLALLTSVGGFSGLPQAHRTRGTPRASTRTAVPACSTDWNSTTAPLL
ncbi:hypothetical protein GCM10010502_22480 [Kitasatospora aureofaciens]|uniref:Uncharacterized protein n=1 Tax=Kitasatospora aureofaciens TaxID=1894 RepID=A0A8H9HJ64_KITAU|nr:hypothetical protein [Kitasatospora aureofaciens]GGU70478.1 hypothetical protein GCM10010502_22480 [Kitasatospora aureofaciens]